MLDGDDLRVFARVAEDLSLTKAARRLGRAKSTVSRQIARLERAAGGPLIDRSSRRLRLTALGLALASEAIAVDDALTRARAVVDQARAAPGGRLRVNAPQLFTACFLAPRLPAFLARHPDIDVVIDVSSTPVGEDAPEADLMIRIGALKDSAMKARKLGESELRLYAAPAALGGLSVAAAQDRLAARGAMEHLALGSYRQVISLSATGQSIRSEVWEPFARRELVLAGGGAAWLPAFLCAQDEREGRLVDLAPREGRGPIPIHALFSASLGAAPSMRAFLDFLQTCMSPLSAVGALRSAVG